MVQDIFKIKQNKTFHEKFQYSYLMKSVKHDLTNIKMKFSLYLILIIHADFHIKKQKNINIKKIELFFQHYVS